MERRSLILDAGALIALSRGDRTVRKILEAAQEADADVVAPSVVVAQTIRGGPGDASINQLLRVVRVSFVGKRLAIAAGTLLGRAQLSDAVDGLVMAEAIRSGPSVLLTSDPDDMARLAADRSDVKIVHV
jgi:hypothetical protein